MARLARTSPTLTQAGGAIDAQGSGAVVLVGGYLDYTGGTVTGEFDTVGATVDVASSVTAAAQINLRGANTLLENAAPEVTLDVQSDYWDSGAVLTAADGAVNAGTILLDSIQGARTTELIVGDGSGVLTNASTGVIDALQGTGGGRSLQGSVVNDGLLDVEAGVELDVTATGVGPHLTQAGGAIVADGLLILDGGRFDDTGGTVSGAFYLNSAAIDVADTVTASTNLYAAGEQSVLLDNASPSVTIVLQAGTLGEWAVLTTAAGAANAGVITLQASQGYGAAASSLVVGGTSFINTATGQIIVQSGGGQNSIDAR